MDVHTASAAGQSDANVVIETSRLRLRELESGDAGFILELVNDPAWLRFIGDRNVRTLDDARGYIDNGPRASYASHGFGLWLVERSHDGERLGLCGLIKRDTLEDVDIGFAFLPRHAGQGYAVEAASATLRLARDTLQLTRLVAIVSPDNEASIRLLGKLGLVFERTLDPSADGKHTALYGRAL